MAQPPPIASYTFLVKTPFLNHLNDVVLPLLSQIPSHCYILFPFPSSPPPCPPKATKATFQFNHSVTADHTARSDAMQHGGRRVWERFFKHPLRLWFLAIYALFCILLTLKFQRYIFSSDSEFQEKVPELPVKYKNYCILPNVFLNEFKDYDRIAQILHVSANLLDDRLVDQVVNWNAPVSLSVVLLHPQQYSCVFKRLNQTIASNPILSRFLRVHILFPSSWSPNCTALPLVDHECIHQLATIDDIANYPANIARNAARMFSSSKYILIADYEHLFSNGFEEEVRKVAEMELEKEKKLLVYRIFEIEKNATAPETKEDLEELMKKGQAVVFHSKFYRGAHDIPKLKEWFSENITDSGIFLKDVKYRKSHWEPQFVSRSDIPLHDTNFPFLIRDNTVLRWELCRMGYQLDILSNHFMYHRGIKTKKSKSISKPVQAKNYSKFKKALAAFKTRMDKDFPDKGGKCPRFKA